MCAHIAEKVKIGFLFFDSLNIHYSANSDDGECIEYLTVFNMRNIVKYKYLFCFYMIHLLKSHFLEILRRPYDPFEFQFYLCYFEITKYDKDALY